MSLNRSDDEFPNHGLDERDSLLRNTSPDNSTIGVKEAKERLLVILLTISMSVGLLATGFGVYSEGRYFTHHQYNFPIWYPVLCIITYGVLILLNEKARRLCAKEMCKISVYAPIGFMWSVNYAFILTSSPYVSNIFQVLFTQMQLVYNYFMNKFLLGNKFSGEQGVIILSTILLNMLLIGDEIDFGDASLAWVLFWQLIFLFNGVGGSVASIFTEAYFKSIDGNDSSIDVGVGAEFNREYSKTLVLNFITNFYAFIGNFAFIYIVYPIEHRVQGMDVWSENMYSKNSWTYYTMFSGTMVFTISSTILFRYTNVTYTAVMSNIANLSQIILVALPIGYLQQPSTQSQYMIAVALTILSLLYAHFQMGLTKDTQISEESILIKYYKEHCKNRKINLFIVCFFIFIIGVTLPLALVSKPPPEKSCCVFEYQCKNITIVKVCGNTTMNQC